MTTNFNALTLKLTKAIRLKYGQTLLFAYEQKVSETTGRIYTEYRLYINLPVEEYNKRFPADQKDLEKYKSKYVKVLLKKSIKIQELFMFLLHEIWEKLESGETYIPDKG